MLPDPLDQQVPPLKPLHVHVAVSDAGRVSATVAPMALLGPALLAVIVYVADPPAVTVLTPSVLVIERSAWLNSIVSDWVAELLLGTGSVTPPGAETVAVFVERARRRRRDRWLHAVQVLDARSGEVHRGRRCSRRRQAVHVPPPAPAQVELAPSGAGKVSATVTPVAWLGPALLAVIVYVTDPPATAVLTPSVLVIGQIS